MALDRANDRGLTPIITRFASNLLRIIRYEGVCGANWRSSKDSAGVSLDFGLDTITLSISDNGRGFVVPDSPAEMAPEGHYGLRGLHERAELIGGRLTIQSAQAHGTTVAVRLPYQRIVDGGNQYRG